MKTKRWISIVVGIACAVGIYLAIRAIVGEPDVHARVTAAPVQPRVVAPRAAPATNVVAAAPVQAAESPPSADDDLMRALAGKKPRREAPAVPVQRPRGNYEIHTVEGFSIVHLGPGAPTTKPFGGPSDDRRRTISGRVVDRAGRPIANAIVLANRGFNIRRDDVMTIGSAITDAAGAFTASAPAGDAYALALVRDDWSEIVAARDRPIELRMLGHGALVGRFTYDGDPETFSVHVAMHGMPFAGNWRSEADGTITIPSLPPARYKVSVGLAQAFAGGASNRLVRDVTIVDGTTAELALAFAAGTTLVLTATPPAGSRPKAITYWLFTGRAPSDGAEARVRKKAESTPSFTLGGGANRTPAEFHDIAPGTYHACAGFFDVATMDALDRPFGCATVHVDDTAPVREVEIVLAD